jgi:hypothetical protein
VVAQTIDHQPPKTKPVDESSSRPFFKIKIILNCLCLPVFTSTSENKIKILKINKFKYLNPFILVC